MNRWLWLFLGVVGCSSVPTSSPTVVYETVVENPDSGPLLIVEPPEPFPPPPTEENPMPVIIGRQSQPNTLTTGNPTPINGLQVQLFAADKKTPEAGAMTIQFAVTPPVLATDVGTGVFQAQALINWTISGNRTSRRISVANGTAITGIGESVLVQLEDVTTGLLAPAFLGAQYGIEVQAGLGVRGSISQLPILQEQVSSNVTIVGGAAHAFRVPLDAGIIAAQISVISNTTPSSPIDVIAVQSSDNAPPGTGPFTRYNPQIQSGMVPMPSGVKFIIVTNRDPANAVTVSLSWGIEG